MTFLGCHYVSRSAYRKLAAYEPERLLTLDPRQMRVAFLLDSRAALNLDGTLVRLEAGFRGEIEEVARFPSVSVAEGASIAGLPKADKGMRWTVVAPRAEDFPLLEQAWVFFWREVAQDARRPKEKERSEEEKSALRAEFVKLFPALQGIETRKDDFEFIFYYYWTVPPPPELPTERFPMEIWVLLDPKDGWFRLVKGPLNLNEI